MSGIIGKIEAAIEPGTIIPKPLADGEHRVTGWGIRRGERALIYSMPNRQESRAPALEGPDRVGPGAGLRTADVGGEVRVFVIYLGHARVLQGRRVQFHGHRRRLCTAGNCGTVRKGHLPEAVNQGRAPTIPV